MQGIAPSGSGGSVSKVASAPKAVTYSANLVKEYTSALNIRQRIKLEPPDDESYKNTAKKLCEEKTLGNDLPKINDFLDRLKGNAQSCKGRVEILRGFVKDRFASQNVAVSSSSSSAPLVSTNSAMQTAVDQSMKAQLNITPVSTMTSSSSSSSSSSSVLKNPRKRPANSATPNQQSATKIAKTGSTSARLPEEVRRSLKFWGDYGATEKDEQLDKIMDSMKYNVAQIDQDIGEKDIRDHARAYFDDFKGVGVPPTNQPLSRIINNGVCRVWISQDVKNSQTVTTESWAHIQGKNVASYSDPRDSGTRDVLRDHVAALGGRSGDTIGHIVGRALAGGTDEADIPENVFPQVNDGNEDMNKVESILLDKLRTGQETELFLHIKLNYQPNATRPISVTHVHQFKGNKPVSETYGN